MVSAVIRIGRKRTRPPVMSASVTDIPLSLSCSTKAMRTMALVTTIPMSSSRPIMAGRPRVRPVIARATSTPMRAKGRLVTMTIGFLRDPRLATITKYIRMIPIAIERKMA